jgi:hypothetical protein
MVEARVRTGTPGNDKANPHLRWTRILAHQDVVIAGETMWAS